MLARIQSSIIGWWGQINAQPGWSEFVSKHTWIVMQALVLPIIIAPAAILGIYRFGLSQTQAATFTFGVGLLGASLAVAHHHLWDDDQSTLIRSRR